MVVDDPAQLWDLRWKLLHQALLQTLDESCRDRDSLPALLRELLDAPADGRAKLYVTWKTLKLRRAHPRLFADGQYLELQTEGPKAGRICAFARRWENDELLVVAPRWFALLGADSGKLTDSSAVCWDGTRVRCPESPQLAGYRNVFTDGIVQAQHYPDHAWLNAADLLRSFPLALLLREGPSPGGTAPGTTAPDYG